MSRPPSGLRALVVDDEAPARDELAYLLGRDSRVASVRACDSATSALRLLHAEPIDVVFADIAMPGLTGLELAAVIGRFADPPSLVFVTAHDEHAVEAFDLDAVDYLLKPVREDRLRAAVRRARDAREHAALTLATEPGPAGSNPEPGEDDTIPVELGGVTRFVARSQVSHVEAQGDYTRLHTATGSHLVRLSLTALEDRWGRAGFVRIHRSLLVSLDHVEEVRNEQGHCTVLVAGQQLHVSRRLTPALRDRLRRSRTGVS